MAIADDKIYSVEEFASEIKKKYNQYKDVDDSTLVAKIIEKYPQYKDRVDMNKKKVETVVNPGPSQSSGTPSASTEVDNYNQFAQNFNNNFNDIQLLGSDYEKDQYDSYNDPKSNALKFTKTQLRSPKEVSIADNVANENSSKIQRFHKKRKEAGDTRIKTLFDYTTNFLNEDRKNFYKGTSTYWESPTKLKSGIKSTAVQDYFAGQREKRLQYEADKKTAKQKGLQSYKSYSSDKSEYYTLDEIAQVEERIHNFYKTEEARNFAHQEMQLKFKEETGVTLSVAQMQNQKYEDAHNSLITEVNDSESAFNITINDNLAKYESEISTNLKNKFNKLQEQVNAGKIKQSEAQAEYDKMNEASSKMYSERANKLYNDKLNIELSKLPKRYNLSEGDKAKAEKLYKQGIKSYYAKKQKEQMTYWKSLSLPEKINKTQEYGWNQVTLAVGGFIAKQGYDAELQNDMVTLGNKLRQGSQGRMDEIPIPDVGEFNVNQLANPDWWHSRVGTTVPFMMSLLPLAIGGAYGGSAVAATVGVGTIGTAVAGGVTGAVLSRPMESAMEAGMTFDRLLKEGRSLDDASIAASEVFSKNMNLASLDALQITAALTPTKYFKGLLGKGAVISGASLIEGGEEIYQGYSEERAVARLDKVPFMNILEYAKTPHGMEQGVIGSIFGGVMHTTLSALAANPELLDGRSMAFDYFSRTSYGMDQDGRMMLPITAEEKLAFSYEEHQKYINARLTEFTNGVNAEYAQGNISASERDNAIRTFSQAAKVEVSMMNDALSNLPQRTLNTLKFAKFALAQLKDEEQKLIADTDELNQGVNQEKIKELQKQIKEQEKFVGGIINGDVPTFTIDNTPVGRENFLNFLMMEGVDEALLNGEVDITVDNDPVIEGYLQQITDGTLTSEELSNATRKRDESSKDKEIRLKGVDRAVQLINTALPEIEVVKVKDDKEMIQKRGGLQQYRGASGLYIGKDKDSGKLTILINENRADMGTVFHEAAHPVTEKIQNELELTYGKKKGKQIYLERLENFFVNTPEAQPFLDWSNRRYKVKSKYEIYDEAFVQYLSDVAKNKIEDQGVPSMLKKFTEYLGGLKAKFVKNESKTSYTDQDFNDLLAFADNVAEAFVTGQQIDVETQEVVEQPVQEEAVEQPAEEETTEQPVKEEVVEQPVSEEVVEQPETKEFTEEEVEQAMEEREAEQQPVDLLGDPSPYGKDVSPKDSFLAQYFGKIRKEDYIQHGDRNNLQGSGRKYGLLFDGNSSPLDTRVEEFNEQYFGGKEEITIQDVINYIDDRAGAVPGKYKKQKPKQEKPSFDTDIETYDDVPFQKDVVVPESYNNKAQMEPVVIEIPSQRYWKEGQKTHTFLSSGYGGQFINLPKSVTKIEELSNNKIRVTIPRWLFNKQGNYMHSGINQILNISGVRPISGLSREDLTQDETGYAPGEVPLQFTDLIDGISENGTTSDVLINLTEPISQENRDRSEQEPFVKEEVFPKKNAVEEVNKIAEKYNINQSGFSLSKNINNIQLAKELKPYGFGVKQAKSGNWFITKGGRFYKPYAKAQMDPVVIPQEEITMLDPSDFQGQIVGFMVGDRLAVGSYTGLDPESGINVPLRGGMMYPFQQGYHGKAGWAFSNESAQKRHANKVKFTTNGVFFVGLMGSGAVKGSRTFGHAYAAELEYGIQSGKIKEKDALRVINQFSQLSPIKNQAIKSASTRAGVIQAAKDFVENNFQFDSVQDFVAFMKSDKIPFALRQEILNAFYSPQTGNPKVSYKGANMPDVPAMVELVEEPAFKGYPNGTIVSAVQFDQADTKSFDAKTLGVETHTSYPKVSKGRGLGMFEKPFEARTFINDFAAYKGVDKTRYESASGYFLYPFPTANVVDGSANLVTGKAQMQFVLPTDLIPQAVKQFYQEQLTTEGLLPRNIYEQRTEMDAAVRAKMFTVDKTLGRLRDAIKKDPNSKEDVVMAINGILNPVESQGLPGKADQKVIEIARQMRSDIDGLSRQLLDGGFVQGDLEMKMFNNLGAYLNRSYQAFDDANYESKVPKEVFNRAVAFIRNEFEGMPKEEAEGMVKSILYDAVNEGGVFEGAMSGKITGRNLDVLKKRKDIPLVIRELLGEYKDPMLNYYKTMNKLATLVEKTKFLSSVREMGDGSIFYDKPTNTHYAEIKPSESNKPLTQGKSIYTTPEFAKAMETLGSKELPSWFRQYLKIQSLAKYSKTILSPMTHTRNWVSNISLVMAGGHYDILKGVFDPDLRRLFGGVTEESMRRYIELGVAQDGAYSGEFQALMKDATKGDADITSMTDNLVERTGKNGKRFIEKLYQAEDDFWKIYVFEKRKQLYTKAYPEMSTDEIEKMSADYVKNHMPTYSRIPKLVQNIRKAPIGTFVSFPAEMIRTTKNNIITIGNDANSDNPVLQKHAAKQLAGLTVAMLGTGAAATFLNQLLKFDDNDDDDLRYLLADWDKNAQLLLLSSEDGVVDYVNTSYTDPFAMFKKPILAAIGAGKYNSDSITHEMLKSFFDPFLSEDMLAEKILDVTRNQDKDGRRIYNPELETVDKDLEILKAKFLHIYKALEPGAQSQIGRVAKGFAGETHRGRELNPFTEIAAIVTGVRKTRVDLLDSFTFKLNDFEDANSNSKRLYYSDYFKYFRTQNDKTPGGDPDLKQKAVEAFEDANEALTLNAAKQHRIYKAVTNPKFQIDNKKVEETIRKRVRSLRDKTAIYTGQTYRLLPFHRKWNTDEQQYFVDMVSTSIDGLPPLDFFTLRELRSFDKSGTIKNKILRMVESEFVADIMNNTDLSQSEARKIMEKKLREELDF